MFLHVDREDSDQTGCTCHFVGFVLSINYHQIHILSIFSGIQLSFCQGGQTNILHL